MDVALKMEETWELDLALRTFITYISYNLGASSKRHLKGQVWRQNKCVNTVRKSKSVIHLYLGMEIR